MKRYFGDNLKMQEDEITAQELLGEVSKKYEAFHLIIGEGNYCHYHGTKKVMDAWENLLGRNAILVTNHKKLGEVVVSILKTVNGKDVDSVIDSWDDIETQEVVETALENFR